MSVFVSIAVNRTRAQGLLHQSRIQTIPIPTMPRPSTPFRSRPKIRSGSGTTFKARPRAITQ